MKSTEREGGFWAVLLLPLLLFRHSRQLEREPNPTMMGILYTKSQDQRRNGAKGFPISSIIF
jgi:hypothetical protein